MAIDPNKKFLYFNKDATTSEMDSSLCFPVSRFIGIETISSSTADFYFEGSKGVDATIIRVYHEQYAYIKSFMASLVDEINFGDKAFIKVYDHAERGSSPSDVSVYMMTSLPPSFTLEDATIDLGTVLSVEYGGTGASTLTADGVLFGNGTAAISAVDLSNNGFIIVGGATPKAVHGSALAGSGLAATLGDGTLVLDVETLNQDTTGSAATLTTPRAINGVDFDGSAPITIAAAGSTLSDTVTVAKGGTGATSLTADGVLFGNGTSAISAVDLSTNGNVIVGGSTPAVVTGANLAGSGLAATVGDGTLVLDVETLNQDTTGNAGTATVLETARAINGVNFNGATPITITAAGSTLSDTVPVSKGGTGLTTVAANTILTGNGTSALTAEAYLTFGSARLTIGDSSADIQPYIRMFNDENTLELGIANGADDFVGGSVDGDVVLNSFGNHNVIIGQNDVAALTIDTNGDSNFNRRFTISAGADGDYEGDVVYFGGTTSMTLGRIYHYKSDGTWEGADADGAATSDGLLAVALGAASDTNGMLLRGMVTLDHDPGAVGDVLYLSTAIGTATATAPSGNNNIVRVLGYCVHATAGNIWFNPDNTFVEVTA